MIQSAKIINVIEVRSGESLVYFTIDGIHIGGFDRGSKIESTATPPETVKPAGKVVKPLSPKQAKAESEIEAERSFSDILKRKSR